MTYPTLIRHQKEIHNIDDFLNNGYNFREASIHSIDFGRIDVQWESLDLHHSVFLGCTFSNEDYQLVFDRGGTIFPNIKGLPYNKYRSKLYTWQELYEVDVVSEQTIDLNIYNHFSESKYHPSVVESLCQRLHDHAIDDALRDYLKPDKDGEYDKKCVGIMGGHGTLRSDAYFRKTAKVCQQLTKKGYLVCSGGGPGMMEAANLGAYFGDYTETELEQALDLLALAPHYSDKDFHSQAMEVLRLFPKGSETVAIPTWFYGHEPSNVFASHIAKYFSNSIREDTLLAICLHGILFAPGSAGTTQEIFMDAAQNHYATFGYYSPMICFGRQRYEVDTNLFKTLKELSLGTGYESMVHLTDDVDEAVQIFLDNPPIPAGDK